MVNILRKYQQTLLIAVTILVIITFIWFWNGNMGRGGGFAGGGGEKVASIYGAPITQTDIQREVRKFQIAAALGLTPLIEGLAGNAQSEQQALENYVWNSYVFRHEADTLQIFPTDAEVEAEEARIPAFQTAGKFDPAKLAAFVTDKLPSLGFTDTVIDELVRDQVRLRKVVALIGSTVDISKAEFENRITEQNEKMDLDVVRLNVADVEKSIAVTDTDAQIAYNTRKDLFRSDEERKVDIASFELTDAQKALTGKDRTDALQKLGNDAWAFAQAVVDKNANFADQAKKFGAPVTTSAMFTAAQPDPALSKIPSLASNAFRLSSNYPSSDVLQGQNGYYVIHLAGMVPSAPLTFEQAKPKIVAEMRKERASQVIQTRANEIRDRMLAGLKAGKSFPDAALAAGVTAEVVPPFSLMDASKIDLPDAQSILGAAVSLPDGQISDFVTTQSGGLFVYVKDRQAPDKATLAGAESATREQVLGQKQMGAFLEWMRFCKQSARLTFVQRSS